MFLAGGAVVWFAFPRVVTPKAPSKTHDCTDKYPLISPRVDCQANDQMADQIESLRVSAQKILDEETKAQHIKRASVFFRDLNTKRWFDIDGRAEFYPGSLVKLPLAMSYYKMAEIRPDVLMQVLAIPKDDTVTGNSDQHYPPQDPLQPSTPYTIGEMIRHMLVYSDNAPFDALMNFGAAFVEKGFNDLGVREVRDDKGNFSGWSSTVNTYSAALRALYNASYLQSASSNAILDLMTQSTFTRGIVSGVPAGTKVAHKFGEGTGTNAAGEFQTYTLNDCGIVYKPNQPFILCVMTEGQDFDQMEKVIQKLAAIAYTLTPLSGDGE